MVKEKPPTQLRGSNDCGAAVAYTMILLGQGKAVSYDPKLLPALRQWIQGVIMYANLNPGPVTPEWYVDLASVRLQILDEKEYDRYQEAEENLRQVICAGGDPESGSALLSLAGREGLSEVGRGMGAEKSGVSVTDIMEVADGADLTAEAESRSEISSITLPEMEEWQEQAGGIHGDSPNTFQPPRPIWEETVADVIANLGAGHGLPRDLWAACRSCGGFPCDPVGGAQSIFSAAMGSLPPLDTSVRGSVILSQVVDWLCANRSRPCLAVSASEFTTPEVAWEEEGGDLWRISTKLLKHF